MLEKRSTSLSTTDYEVLPINLYNPMPVCSEGKSSSEYDGLESSLDSSIGANTSKECLYSLEFDGEELVELLGIVEAHLLYLPTNDIKVRIIGPTNLMNCIQS